MQIIMYKNKKIAIIDKIDHIPDGLNFYGSKEDDIQVGSFKYPENKIMRSHMHITRPRTIEKTQEILIVWKGSCRYRLYGFDKIFISSDILSAGSFLILYNGGVGYTILENDTTMLEIKAGSYNVVSDNEDRILL